MRTVSRDAGNDCVMAAGKAEITKLSSQLFEQSPTLRTQVVTRITAGEFVIDEERVSGLVSEGMPPQLHTAGGRHIFATGAIGG